MSARPWVARPPRRTLWEVVGGGRRPSGPAHTATHASAIRRPVAMPRHEALAIGLGCDVPTQSPRR